MSTNIKIVGTIYLYSRIMKIDDIAFNNCAMPIYMDSIEINKYISMCKKKDCSDIVKSMAL